MIPARVSDPLDVRGATLRNRVVGAPMERNLCELSGRPTGAYATYLGERARGGAALLFTESSYVREDSRARLRQMGMHDDLVLPGLRAVADAVHRHGALLGVELNHAGRVVAQAVSYLRPVGPSPVPCTEIGGDLPLELDLAGIDAVVRAFAEAAERALRGGADVISVHAAHGYLIGQFVSPRSNHRGDRYRAGPAFLDDVLIAVRERIGPRVPLFLRWSAFEGLPGGRDTEDSLRVLERARLDLVDVVDLSAGTYGAGHWITPSGEVPEGYLGETARRYREATGLLVSMAGRITRPQTAARLVEEGATDLVSVARALHADPAWAEHALRGTEPRPCISGNQGCADVIFAGQPLWCTVNPRTGHEADPDPVPAGAAVGATVLVVGAGPAGLEAALALAEGGADVTLADEAEQVGGQMRLAARMPAKPQFGRIVSWYADRLAHLGVDVRLGRRLRLDDVAPGVAAVVDATGGRDYVPRVPGGGASRVVGVREWLHEPSDDAEVVVWGADRCATYTADLLASEGRSVLLVAGQRELAADAGARERLPAMERLTRSGRVRLLLGHTLDRVLADAVVVSHDGVVETVPATGPVLASRGVLPRGLVGDGVAPDVLVHRAGEAAGASSLDEVIASGHEVARQVLTRLAVRRPGT